MAINRLMVSWIIDLERNFKIFSESKSIAELGPSDLMPAAQKIISKDNPSLRINKTSARDWFYSLGIIKYIAFDIADDSRAKKINLSNVHELEKTWDIVSNFGTSEHIFNQFAVMKNCHNFTKVGGVMLHVVPISSGMNHGFYNYHPRFFLESCIGKSIRSFRFQTCTIPVSSI